MKITLLILVISIFSAAPSTAQNKKRIYLFDDFVSGKALMYNNATINASFNYDVANQEMMYMEGEEKMVLTNTQQVDTIFVDNRKFIPANRRFLEQIVMSDSEVYINWIFKEIYKGKRGSFGQITQTNVTVINTNHFRPGTVYEKETRDVFENKNQNEYWLLNKEKPIKITNKRSLLNAFDENREEVEALYEKHHIDFNNVEEVLWVVNEASKLSQD